MAAYGILGFVILLLIYFVMRTQNMQRQLHLNKLTVKANNQQVKAAMSAILPLSDQLQKSYLAQFDDAHKHGLLSQQDYQIGRVILANMRFVVLQCVERNSKVEDAVKKAAYSSGGDFSGIQKFIAKQPNQVRMAWCKNSISGFIFACHYISQAANLKPQGEAGSKLESA